MISKQQTTTVIFAVPALLMAAAFFGNLFAEGWNWSPFDFIIAAVLLFGTAFLIHLVIRSEKAFRHKLMICLAIVFVLVLVWVELAVGIFGSPFAGS